MKKEKMAEAKKKKKNEATFNFFSLFFLQSVY